MKTQTIVVAKLCPLCFPCGCGAPQTVNVSGAVPFIVCTRSGFGTWDPINGTQNRCPYAPLQVGQRRKVVALA